MRKEQGAPPLTALETWLCEQRARLSNSSAVAKSIDYMLRRGDLPDVGCKHRRTAYFVLPN